MTDGDTDARGYARRLVKGSAIVFVLLVASGLAAFLLRMFLARALVAEDITLGVKEGYHYGLFYAIFAVISFLLLLCDLGLNSALVKYIPEFSVRKDFSSIKSSIVFVTIFKVIFAFSVFCTVFVFSGQIAAAVFQTEAAVLPLQILCLWFFMMIFYSILRNAFLGFQNMLAYAGMEFFWIFSVLFVSVLFVGIFGWGVRGAAFSYFFAVLIIIIFTVAYFWKRYPHILEQKVSINRPLVKTLFAFALFVFIGGLGGWIISYMDIIMITLLRTVPEVGFYQVAEPTAQMLWMPAMALSAVFFPMVSELWARRQQAILKNMLHLLIKFSFVVIIPIALVFITFPEIVIRLLFGEGYLASAGALQILSGAAILYTLFAILMNTMNGIGKPIITTIVVGAMAVFNFIGNFILIPLYGIEGAAAASLFSFLIGVVLLLYYARKFVEFTVPASSLLKTVVGGLLTLLLIFSLKSILVLHPWFEAFIVVMISLVYYGVWVLITRAVTRDDLKTIARIVPIPGWLLRAVEKLVKKRNF